MIICQFWCKAKSGRNEYRKCTPALWCNTQVKFKLILQMGIALFVNHLYHKTYFCREDGNLYDVCLCRGCWVSVQTRCYMKIFSLLYHSRSRSQWGLSMQGRDQYPVPFIRATFSEWHKRCPPYILKSGGDHHHSYNLASAQFNTQTILRIFGCS